MSLIVLKAFLQNYCNQIKSSKTLFYCWIFIYSLFLNIFFYNPVYIFLLKNIYYPGSFRGEVFFVLSVCFICSSGILISNFVINFTSKILKNN